MDNHPLSTLKDNLMTRRRFLWLSSLAAAGFTAGCATNPVTGKSQLMLVSEDQEIQIDQQYSPYQFSADYGTTQDTALNNYIERTGKNMTGQTHRTPHALQFSCGQCDLCQRLRISGRKHCLYARHFAVIGK